jgi:predicted DNA-binding transcriptional regulator YafY
MLGQIETARHAWSASQRLEFIEFRAFWEGGINRGDLMEKFDVSVQQASNDLTRYRTMAPSNLDYDASAKRYVMAETFKAIFDSPSAERYLAQLKMLAEGVIGLDETFIGAPPPAIAMPVPRRVVDSELFRSLLAASRERTSVELRYQSMNAARPAAHWRRVTPHGFGSDGLRWHVRGYCHIDKGYKDFIVSRVSNIRDPGAAGPLADQDEDWNAIFNVVIEPNPALSEDQRAAVAWEYAMPKGRSILPVRRALLYYLKKRLRLDVPDDSPSETPIVVANRIEFEDALASAKGAVAEGEFE